ncbi:MAG: AMP-binding protein [Proteobacteria bacterium]|nr:AMP-binding protein [Pseudomonadota bacterium]
MRARNELILADLIALRAEQKPDFPVLTFEHLSLDGGATADEVRTYADLHTHGQRLAAYLFSRQIARGDRFAIMLRNHPEFVEAMVAASMTGSIFVPIDPRTRGEKLAYMINHSGSRGMICADYCLAEVQAIRHQCPGLEWVLVLDSSEDDISALRRGTESLEALLGAPAATVDALPLTPGDPIQIMYTSGTTGDPKGIVCSNARFGGAAFFAQMFGYQPDERPYTGLSLTHSNAQTTAMATALYFAYPAVLSRRFTKSKLWDVCRHYGCTTFSLLGGIATAIYSEPPRANDGDNPVRLVVSAGTPPAIWSAFEERFKVRIFEFYGASDGGGMAFKPPGVGPIGSCGKAAPGFEIRVFDDADNECPPGVTGEICCRPATGGTQSVDVEYLGNPEATRAKVRQGWNRSGDMGHTDTEGWLYFDYRRGGGIRRNGDFINPSFVEKVIAECPGVSDVFVYGVPSSSGAPGECDVVAAIVPVDADRFDATLVFAACRRGLEANFVPGYLQVVAEIPKTASEKPMTRHLLDRFAPDAENVIAAPGNRT